MVQVLLVQLTVDNMKKVLITTVVLGIMVLGVAQIRTIDFSEIGANQAALITGDDSDMDTAGNWVANQSATITGGYNSGDGGHDKTLRIESGDGVFEGAFLALASAQVTGKRYRLIFDYKHIESTNLSNTRVDFQGATTQILTPITISATWTEYSEEFVSVDVNPSLVIY